MSEHNHLEHTTTEISKISRPEHVESQSVLDTVMFSNVINVIIVLALLLWLVRKYNLLSFVEKRRKQIVDSIKASEQEKLVTLHQLEQTKTKVKNLKQEVEKITDEGEQVAENIAERIRKDADKEAFEMNRKAHALLETERKTAENQVTEDVAQAAFNVAEQHIKEAIDDRLHHKFINDFIDNLDNVKV